MSSYYFKAGVTANSHECEVFLDGARLPLCIEASEAGGWARCFQTDLTGEILRDCLGHAMTELRRGEVRIHRHSFAWCGAG
jgi:hypothetical protein